jgi:hypothetical protein
MGAEGSGVVIVGPATREGRRAGRAATRAPTMHAPASCAGASTCCAPAWRAGQRDLGAGWLEGPFRSEPVGLRHSRHRVRYGIPADRQLRGQLFRRRPQGRIFTPNPVVALDALTGKLRWYFQLVHHDLFDYDVAAPPALIEIKRNGKAIPSVAQILDRMMGKPVFGVEDRKLPQNDVPGESPGPRNRSRSSRARFLPGVVQQAAPRRAVYGIRHVGHTDDAGHDGGRQLGPRCLRSAPWLHFVNTSSLGGTGQMVKTARPCPIATRAATRASRSG